MYKIYSKDSLKVFAGTVDGAPKKTERNGETVVVVTLKDYADERINIYFRNGEGKDEKLADRIVNAKVSDGAYIVVRALCNDPEEKTATGVDFKYEGVMKLVDASGNPTSTIVIGKAYRPREKENGDFSVTVRTYDKRTNTTTWVDVTFRDSEKSKAATMAKKVMRNQERPTVVVAGGKVTEPNRAKDNNINLRMFGWRITRKPD